MEGISIPFTGVIRDANGNPLPNACVHLEKDGRRIAQTLSDAAGRYQISVWPPEGGYNIFAIHDKVSAWKLDVELQAGQSQTVSLSLRQGISGKVMTKTSAPLPNVLVQALQNSIGATFVVASVELIQVEPDPTSLAYVDLGASPGTITPKPLGLRHLPQML